MAVIEPCDPHMSNPWLKKNPFMSMWLSGANRIAGSARSQVVAEAKRQINQTLERATDENLKRWFSTAVASRPKTKAKAKTRKR
jgi:hypothetical protein